MRSIPWSARCLILKLNTSLRAKFRVSRPLPSSVVTSGRRILIEWIFFLCRRNAAGVQEYGASCQSVASGNWRPRRSLVNLRSGDGRIAAEPQLSVSTCRQNGIRRFFYGPEPNARRSHTEYGGTAGPAASLQQRQLFEVPLWYLGMKRAELEHTEYCVLEFFLTTTVFGMGRASRSMTETWCWSFSTLTSKLTPKLCVPPIPT